MQSVLKRHQDTEEPEQPIEQPIRLVEQHCLIACIVSLLYDVESSLLLYDNNTSTGGVLIHTFTQCMIVLVCLLLFH